MPFSRASFRTYASVNGDNRATSVGPIDARRASRTAVIVTWRAFSWSASVERYRSVAATSRPRGSVMP